MRPQLLTALAHAGLALASCAAVLAGQNLGDLGSFTKWSKVEIDLQGPSSIGLSNSANPFAIEIDVAFTGPGGQLFTVPAFYDGNGSGGMNGDVWRVRFSPPAEGAWSFASSSSDPILDGYTGTFSVTPPPASATGFAKWGRLEHVDEHYLKFAEGPYWLKGGANEPEDFLAPGVMGDWDGKKAAVDYLASRGVNSLYIMLHNVQGDGENVWPWVSSTDSDHFDVAKLADWEDLFSYIQSKEIVLHLVWEDDSAWTGFNRTLYYREMIARFGHHNGLYWNIGEEFNETYTATQVKNFAQEIRDRDAYDHPITVHNQGGLSNLEPFLGDDRFDLSSFQTGKSPQNSKIIDWRNDSAAAGRPWAISLDESGNIGVGERQLARNIAWSAYMGGGMFELFSAPLADFSTLENHWNDLRHARTFVESMPFWEMSPDNSLLVGGTGRRYCLQKAGEVYAIYLEGGGSIQLDLTGVSGSFEVYWYNPRTGAYTDDGSVSGGGVVPLGSAPFSGDAAVRVRRPSAGEEPVAVISAPADGAAFQPGESIDFSSLGSFDPDGVVAGWDWSFGDGGTASDQNPTYSYSSPSTYTVSLEVEDNDGGRSPPDTIQLVITTGNIPPLASDQAVATIESIPVPISLQYTDPDGPGPYDFTILSLPAGGVLSGEAPTLLYTPNLGFVGSDSFTWVVSDGLDDSNVALVSVSVAGNVAPTALDFSLQTSVDVPLDFSFGVHVVDPDGPGPNSYSVIAPPSNGQLTGDDNDRTYTPDPGFVGLDSFTWRVSDGLEPSNVAWVVVSVSEVLLEDDFGRPDSATVGNGWVEVEGASEVQLANGALRFDAQDEADLPLVRRSFPVQTNGVVIWSFDLDFDRTGSEDNYGFRMQLGDSGSLNDADPAEAGVAINLIWGGPSEGLAGHEGFGYVVDGIVTEIATVSGLQTVLVEADLDSQTFALEVAGQREEGLGFESLVPVDTVRFAANLLNMSNFATRGVDNVTVQRRPPCVPRNLHLENQTIDSVAAFEACVTLSAGDGFEVVSPGDLTLRSGHRIRLRNGFMIGSGASLSAIIDPAAGGG